MYSIWNSKTKQYKDTNKIKLNKCMVFETEKCFINFESIGELPYSLYYSFIIL
jgi:hypothetical protein